MDEHNGWGCQHATDDQRTAQASQIVDHVFEIIRLEAVAGVEAFLSGPVSATATTTSTTALRMRPTRAGMSRMFRRLPNDVAIERLTVRSDRRRYPPHSNHTSFSIKAATIAAIVEGIRETPVDPESKSACDMAIRLGLVGAFESGVADLSTNPVHRNGFGK